MKTNKVAVAGILLFVVAAFALGVSLYRKHVHSAQDQTVSAEQTRLVRMHSPILGPQGAPVTIVEFFDPACETCRAFYPIVKSLMAKYPEDVRLVIRYAPFHRGSDQVVKLLEAARRQGKYQLVLKAVLQAQPTWADHSQPNPDLTFELSRAVGLDIERARQDMARPEMQALLDQDLEDLKALQVSRTPTFFVQGRSLPSFGPDQLAALVAEEVAKAKR
ncbi:disulfide bond formation protein DsbA [Limnohabitans sp. 2KL-1]|uniref:DsbA family protein n=1 Tax=Limnohabitans sp. 2KL-1 TaxID=1100699 RepID=UPI000D387039|nr:thioredoxin domain-containing protein [Limnohabitans sp. 2KL-1]PUE47576.1 disulfide bond formation protein DsbA [Limnohabitans sp. 2KL-1]